ncbi:MAG: hypothetical protein R2754_16020 [Microthrixaceae bacterium]
MRFSTLEIAELLGTGHHGPSLPVEQAVIDPATLEPDRNQLFVASAHPPPLGDTSQLLFGNLADRAPYLTERSWMGGTAISGPSTETMLRTMASDERGRPDGCARVGVLGGAAWATAALLRVALGAPTAAFDLPPTGPPGRREIPGTERFRTPLALLNHDGDEPLVVELNRRHRGCSVADGALLAPNIMVVTDLGDHHLATLGTPRVTAEADSLIRQLGADTALVVSEAVAETLSDGADDDETAAPATFRVATTHTQGPTPGGEVRVSGAWGSLEVEVGPDGGWLGLPIGGAIAAAAATGRNLDEVRERVASAARALTDSIVMNLPEGPVVWDRSDATSVGEVSVALEALAARPAQARFLVLGAMDDGPTATGRQHARLAQQATKAGIVVRSADAWGAGFEYLEHPRQAVDDLAATGPGAVVMLTGTSSDLLSVRHRFLARAGRAT